MRKEAANELQIGADQNTRTLVRRGRRTLHGQRSFVHCVSTPEECRGRIRAADIMLSLTPCTLREGCRGTSDGKSSTKGCLTTGSSSRNGRAASIGLSPCRRSNVWLRTRACYCRRQNQDAFTKVRVVNFVHRKTTSKSRCLETFVGGTCVKSSKRFQ